MHDIASEAVQFIDLTAMNIIFLFVVGFIGGLVSGFIGSGGAFVLTPGMMSLGVVGTVAVASNMCHKFPKAMVGAFKRFKYGQVDVKLGLVMSASAGIGVWMGIKIQEMILAAWGQAGSNLYVSLSFVVILVVVGGYVFYDAWKTQKTGGEVKVSSLALKLQKYRIVAHDELQGRQGPHLHVVHLSHRLCHRDAGGHHRGGRLHRGAGHDLRPGGHRPGGFGY